jgi:histidinol-phosphate aminotransferase
VTPAGSDSGIERLIRPDLAGFSGYAASKSPETLAGRVKAPPGGIVKLDANENPYGCSPRVNEALAAYAGFSVYPDASQSELKELLAGYTGVSAEHIVAAAGSDQLIDLLIRLFVAPGDEVINCPPTFAMFRFFTELNGGKLVEVPRDDNFAVRLHAVKKAITARTKLIFLATPNNPTGTVTPRGDILEMLDTGVPVLVDEAYYEFIGHTVAPLMDKYPNLMVLRTFSKWAGLAGLRIGYGLFPPKIADYLMSIKEPYCVNAAAMVAVRETLKDIDYLMANVKAIIAERRRLFTGLEKLGWLRPYRSQANFILCAVAKGSAKELQRELEGRGILVRYFDQPLLRNYIRISIGRSADTDILLKTLEEIGGSYGQ